MENISAKQSATPLKEDNEQNDKILNETELEAKLRKLSLDDLRKAIRYLHEQIKEFKTYKNDSKNYRAGRIKPWIKALELKYLKEGYYEWVKSKTSKTFETLPYSDDEAKRKDIAIEALIHIFYKRFRVQPKFNKNNLIFKPKGEEYEIEFIDIESNTAINEKEYFIFYYHRASSYTQKDPNIIKENEHVDRGLLEIDKKWENAKLSIVYPNPIDKRRETYTLELL